MAVSARVGTAHVVELLELNDLGLETVFRELLILMSKFEHIIPFLHLVHFIGQLLH